MAFLLSPECSFDKARFDGLPSVLGLIKAPTVGIGLATALASACDNFITRTSPWLENRPTLSKVLLLKFLAFESSQELVLQRRLR